jgi:VWFA-related protein
LRAQDAALEFLKNKITKDDLVAVMMYTSTVNVLSDFTGDRDVLTDVINGLPIGEATELAGLADTGACTEEDTGAAFVADQTEFNILNTDQKLAALEDAAKMLKNLPEKKVMVYLSGGVNKTGIDNQAQLEASINALYKANISLYSIDARGLMADPPGGAASKAGSRGTGAFNGANYNAQRATINDSQETLSTLATETGGKVFLDSNDLALGIQLAQQSMSSYYILGYYTSNLKEDGKYRRISVKLTNGNTSARLEHRQGYYADKDWHRMNGDDKEQQLKEAIAAGDPITDIPLALQIDYFRIGPTTYFVPVSVRVPGSVIELAAKGAGGVTQLDYLGQIQDETRTVVGNVRDYIKISLDEENKERAANRIFQYDAGFTLEPGRYHMKFLVRENVSGKIGTFETRFIVPDLSADTDELKLSTVIWSNQREPLAAAVGAAERVNRRYAAANPLIDGDQKIMPNITHVFRRRQNLFVTFDVYDAHPDPTDRKLRRVKVSLSLFNAAGAKAFEVGPLEVTQVAGTRPDAVPVKLQIPLKDIAPGEYTCQINVVDVIGRKFAFPRAQLVIAP